MHGLIVLWKIYLVLWIAFHGFSLSTRLLFDAGLQNAALLVFGVVSFIPLIAFIVEKPVLGPQVWRIWLLFVLGWALFGHASYSAWFLQPPFDHPLVGLLLAVPGFAATYSYSRSTFSAWGTTA